MCVPLAMAQLQWQQLHGAPCLAPKHISLIGWSQQMGNYDENLIIGLSSASVRIPEGKTGGFPENVYVGVAVKAQAPYVSEFSPSYIFTTKTCNQT
jgi:hypothetical protein